MENGFTSQLMKRVINNPRGRWPTRRTAAKSTFIIIGMIMSQMSRAMGPLIWLPSPISSRRKKSINPRESLPTARPRAMQIVTRNVRYRSKRFTLTFALFQL